MSNSRGEHKEEARGAFETPVKTILNSRGHIFLMPLGEPAQEADECDQTALPRPNSLMMNLVDEALTQHPEWLEKVELTPASLGLMMSRYPEKIEKFKRHSQIKGSLKNRILLNGETALGLAVQAGDLAMVRWLVEEVEVDITQPFANKYQSQGKFETVNSYSKRSRVSAFLKREKGHTDAIELAMCLGKKDMVKYFLGRQKGSLQNAAKDSYLVVAMQYDTMPLVFFDAIGSRKISSDCLGQALCAAVALPQHFEDSYIEALLKEGANPENALIAAISIGNIQRVLRLMQLAACKITPRDREKAEKKFEEAEEDVRYDYYVSSDTLITAGIIKYAILLCAAIQQAVADLAKNNEENTVDENKQENITIIENLINDIKKIDVPMMCRLDYLSTIMNAIRASLAEHAAIAAGVTFFAERYMRTEYQKVEPKKLEHWSRILLEKDEKQQTSRNCFNLFYKTATDKKHKILVRDELYKGLNEKVKSLKSVDEQMEVKKQTLALGASMFTLAANGKGGIGTRGQKMMKEVHKYETRRFKKG